MHVYEMHFMLSSRVTDLHWKAEIRRDYEITYILSKGVVDKVETVPTRNRKWVQSHNTAP